MELLKSLLTAQPGSLLILFGMALLFLAIVGAVKGKISLDSTARRIAGALGLISLAFGIWLQTHAPPSPGPAQAQPIVAPSPRSSSHSGDTPSEEDRSQAVGATKKPKHPSDEAIRVASAQQASPPPVSSHSAPTISAPLQSGSSQPDVAATPTVDSSNGSSQKCRVNPQPWRWMTTGRLLVEVDGKSVGKIDVGRNQSGFNFACTPGDHRYSVRSDTMAVACTGGILLETDATTLDLVFSQTAPGPPDCSLAVTSNR